LGFVGVVFFVREEVDLRGVVLKEVSDDTVSNSGRAASNNIDLS
jgi:hypothetical protein